MTDSTTGAEIRNQIEREWIALVMSLGKTDHERARALGVSTRMVRHYRTGYLPECIRRLRERNLIEFVIPISPSPIPPTPSIRTHGE